MAFLLLFINLFLQGGEALLVEGSMEGLDRDWDWGAWCEISKELVKNLG